MQPSIPSDILAGRRFVLFLGADLPRIITGLPSRADLARGLAQHHGLDSVLSLAQVAQRVSRAGNRFDFTDYLRRELDTAGKPVPVFYRNLTTFAQAHTLPAIITTAYDDFLERALRDAGVPFDRIVKSSDVAFVRPDRLMLFKLYGDIQMPDTLVVTEDDHYSLWRDRDKENLLDEVRGLFKKQTVLFLGYNLSDPDFNLLWREVLDRMGRFARTAYAVWPGLPEEEQRVWLDRMIQVLDADPWGLVEGQECAVSVHPTPADLRQFRDRDFDQLTEALNDVRVAITGDSPLLKTSAITSWKQITSRIEVPEEIDALFRMICEARQLGMDSVAQLTVEQLQSVLQGIEHILEFLHSQFPDAGIKGVSFQQQPITEIPRTREGTMDYKLGFRSLRVYLAEAGSEVLSELATLEERFNKNERAERLFGSSENIRNERSQIIFALNELALEYCGISFNDLCAGKQLPAKSMPNPAERQPDEIPEHLRRSETKLDQGRAEDRGVANQRLGKGGKGQGTSGSSKTYHGIAKAWAVLVGINHYDDPFIAGLKVCVDDVTAIQQALAGRYQAARLLTDATPDHLPTRANILGELSTVVQTAGEDDLLLFYFSGHGKAEGGESYLLARDTRIAALKQTAVAMRDIREIIEQSLAHAKVIVLDACHSGASIGKAEPTMTPEFIQRVFEEAEGMAVLASCKQGQQSWEWPEEGRSVFTYFLLDALSGKADLDGKGFVTVSDASRYVTDGVKAWAVERGVPQTPTLQYAVAGDIILLTLPGGMP